ncbi:MAG: hypothetical protein RIT02_2038 [Planctomycetota bacterium]
MVGASGGDTGGDLFLQICEQAVCIYGDGIEHQRRGLVGCEAADEGLAEWRVGDGIHSA